MTDKFPKSRSHFALFSSSSYGQPAANDNWLKPLDGLVVGGKFVPTRSDDAHLLATSWIIAARKPLTDEQRQRLKFLAREVIAKGYKLPGARGLSPEQDASNAAILGDRHQQIIAPEMTAFQRALDSLTDEERRQVGSLTGEALYRKLAEMGKLDPAIAESFTRQAAEIVRRNAAEQKKAYAEIAKGFGINDIGSGDTASPPKIVVGTGTAEAKEDENDLGNVHHL